MPALAATDVTITRVDLPNNPRIVGKNRITLVKVTFGNGTLTYPTNGVPMPAKEKFGMVRNLDDLLLVDTSPTAYVVKWDRTNKTIRLFEAGAEMATASAPAAQTYYGYSLGW